MANFLDIDYETLMIDWLKEKIIYEIGDDDFAVKAVNMVIEERIIYRLTKKTFKKSNRYFK